VDNTDPSDAPGAPVGCAVLFINYLRYQLGYSLASIVQAGGSTLRLTYQALTGTTGDPFPYFSRLLAYYFPQGSTVPRRV
jgi:hypothetical protein